MHGRKKLKFGGLVGAHADSTLRLSDVGDLAMAALLFIALW
jgi:hypothetical protein